MRAHLGCTSTGRDDVSGSGAPTTPVFRGRSVDGLLGRGVGVDSSHETLNNTEFIVDNLSEGSQAIGGAGSV